MGIATLSDTLDVNKVLDTVLAPNLLRILADAGVDPGGVTLAGLKAVYGMVLVGDAEVEGGGKRAVGAKTKVRPKPAPPRVFRLDELDQAFDAMVEIEFAKFQKAP